MSTLKVHNIEPVSGTDVALGAAGDTITVLGDSLKVNAFKDAGGNTIFQSDGSGTVSNVAQGVTAGPVLISTQTASNNASIDFTTGLDSSYDKYMFVFLNVQAATDNVKLVFNASIDAGSNYNRNKTSTFYRAQTSESGSPASELGYGTSDDLVAASGDQTLTETQGNGADESACGTLYLTNPSNTTFYKNWHSRMQFYHGGNYSEDAFTAGSILTASAVNAIQFKFNSGNIAAGTIKLYGIA